MTRPAFSIWGCVSMQESTWGEFLALKEVRCRGVSSYDTPKKRP